MQKNLIALVALAVISGGARQTIEPGEPVPELTPHDERELIASGAIQDLDAVAAQEKWDAKTEAAARAVFDRARADVAADVASRTAPEAEPAGDAAAGQGGTGAPDAADADSAGARPTAKTAASRKRT